MAASITLAYQWMIRQCNAENIGYSQDYRNEQTVGGITYYDCSSMIYYALIEGGFDLDADAWPFTTSSMGEVLISLGFVRMAASETWKAGDILWRDGHTEMVYSGNITMGAHSSSYDLPDQVSINDYESSSDSWTYCYRYGGGVIATEWIFGNRYLSDSEMQNNAAIIYVYLSSRGWTLNAIAGMLGNMETESTINPAIWQNLDAGNTSLGYGLVQWTPSTNYTNWANSNGYSIEDGYGQLLWIDSETEDFGQWIETDAYPLTFAEYKTSTKTPQYLAYAFLKNFERAGVENAIARGLQALKWYNYLESLSGSISSKKKKRFKFVLFNKNRRDLWTYRKC